MSRKIISLLLVVLMLVMVTSTIFSASAAAKGDVNSDGSVNATDYLLVKRYVIGTKTLSSSQKTSADMDSDGDVDRVDYIMLKRTVLGTLNSSINTSKREAISYSKSYTKNVSPSSSYPDSGNELTDGYIPAAPDIQEPGYSGYDKKDLSVVINLGSAGKDICGFEFYYLISQAPGVHAPQAVTISGSNSANGTYTQIAYRTVSVNAVDGVKKFSINLATTYDYSYIKFEFKKNYAWTFLAETVVYGIVDGQSDATINPYEEDTLTDSQRTSNLNNVKATGTYSATKGRTVISKNASVSAQSGYSADTRVGFSAGRLTDGATTGAHSEKKINNSSVWNGLSLTKTNTLTLTLNNYSAVNDVCGFAIHCFNRPTASIELPKYVDIAVSKNGTTFYNVGRVYAPDTEQENFAFNLYLDTLLSAKKVQFIFPASSGYMWIEEIEVYANRSASVSSSATTGYMDSSSSILGGVKDVALIYFNHNYNLNSVTQNMLLPYVGYLDENGNVIDTMFDGYLFLPQVSAMKCKDDPDTLAVEPTHTPYGTNCAEDWKWYYNEMFKSNYNLDALNKTAEKVKMLLGKSELKLKVFLTIPHMDSLMTDTFGDINGDGVNEIVTTQDGRVATAKLYAKMLQDKFKAQKYENLELCGFYWFHEEIADRDWNYNYTGDAQTAKAVTAGVKAQTGLPMFWIPYYQARGYNSGYSYGFQVVCYQPNYAFDLDTDISRISDAAATARQYGMCIEMEMGEGADVDYRYFQKYMHYLSGGVTYGYMNNALHMYYQNFDTIGRTWDDDSRSRLIYTYTYQFMNGTLDTTPSGVSKISASTAKNTAYIGTVNPQNTDRFIYAISCSPDHGSLAFAEDGSFVYYPNKGYSGTDTFTYKISNYLGWSTECTVSVTVG